MKPLFMIACLLSILLSNAFCEEEKKKAITIGPMVHFNISPDHFQVSWGFEVSYWQSTPRQFLPSVDSIPELYGIDFGIEFTKTKIRVYSEIQYGIEIAGASAGPVLEFERGVTNYGLQSSIWTWGGDLRVRKLAEESLVVAPGLMTKLPVYLKGFTII